MALVDFGRVPSGEARARTVTVQNSGDAPVAVRRVWIDGADAFSIAGDRCTGARLAPRARCAVNVTFFATEAGAHDARLMLPSDAEAGVRSVRLRAVQEGIVDATSTPGGGTAATRPPARIDRSAVHYRRSQARITDSICSVSTGFER